MRVISALLFLGAAATFCGAPVAAARASTLVNNGDFATGDFTGWTLFTTSSNASIGFSPAPNVVSFNVTGSGPTNAAQFQVGQVILNAGVQEGGGLTQSVVSGSGNYFFTANIAAFSACGVGCGNGDAGTFSIWLDGTKRDSVSFGAISNGVTLRDLLWFDTSLVAGSHILEVLITREAQNHGGVPDVTYGDTPFEYVTNITLQEGSISAVPESSTWAMLLIGFAGIAFAGYRKRRQYTLIPSAVM
jgi:hypothetical protein